MGSILSACRANDNPVEREAIRTALPELTVPEFPADTCELASFLEQVYTDCFFTLETTKEDRKRTEAYLANAKRAAERTAAPSIEAFLAGLRTKILLTRVRDEDLPRAAQLTQKTNQFNLTTRRYTEQELRALQTAPLATPPRRMSTCASIFSGTQRVDGRRTASAIA
jgi:FkbH-like protein